MSKLEEKILSILKEDKIKFIREKKFPEMKKHGNYLRFDFYIPDMEVAVEVQGPQHYEYTAPFHKSRQDFLKGQEYDRHKISYCLANDIKIYCIPYWEVEHIERASDIFSKRYRAVDKWKNDRDWEEHQKI